MNKRFRPCSKLTPTPPWTRVFFTSSPEVAAGENTLFGEEGSEVEDEGMRIMLQASAAAEVARIQRITRVGADNVVGSPGGGVGGLNSRPLIGKDPRGDRQSSFEDVSFDGSDSFTMYTVDN